MDMNQRIIFFAVDKTLVDHGTWSVPASASAALVRLKEAGHRLYINTSRSVNEMKNVADLLAPLGLDGMVLSGVSGIVYIHDLRCNICYFKFF